LIGEFYRVFFYITYSPHKPQKFRLDLYPNTPLRIHFLSIFALLNLRACALIVAGYIVFPLFFLLSAAFLSVLRAAGPSLCRVSLCFGLLTAAAISCFQKKERSPAGHAARRVLR
jgi:hypothetical protein